MKLSTGNLERRNAKNGARESAFGFGEGDETSELKMKTTTMFSTRTGTRFGAKIKGYRRGWGWERDGKT